ncbi:MAG: hypothetical protein OXC65_11870 [Thiotrichales bacterium]|nr:hypothetical protein [Thiotrichales bacterium]
MRRLLEPETPETDMNGERPFRFFDNREKYLLFVTTCSEKWAIGQRIGAELAILDPQPPAMRVFDAGTGDGTVMASVLRQLHGHFPTVPFLVVGKEISLEDVRLTLEKLPDRFSEHPQTVVVLTNLNYREAPWLRTSGDSGDPRVNWRELALEGHTAHAFDRQIAELRPVLADWWKVRTSPSTGNPVYVEPSVIVLYRADHRFTLDAVIPRPAAPIDGYDLVIAAQPFRARHRAERKVRLVLEPLAASLAPGGRMITIQSTGQDPGMEIIRRVWPDEDPFRTPGPVLVQELRSRLAEHFPDRDFSIDSESHSFFRYSLHVMPNEVTENIGTSTRLAAWNAAVYVAQIDDERITRAMSDGSYLDATAEVVARHGGLWFVDESFVVVRRE